MKNTTIVLDTLNGYHRMINGVVDIISRKEFSGYATYQYVNSVNDTFAVKMENFRLEQAADDAKVKRSKIPANAHCGKRDCAGGNEAHSCAAYILQG